MYIVAISEIGNMYAHSWIFLCSIQAVKVTIEMEAVLNYLVNYKKRPHNNVL